MEINELIENKINNLDITENYAAILGQSPSKGAKSPKLWNAAFSGLNFSAFMYPFDVLPKNLGALINNLRKDKKFIGGSIAAPYKTDVIKYIDYVEENVKAIGAVNCIYRDKNGKLVGTNTDGAGALWSLQSAYGNIAGVKVLILGAGGAAAAVASYVGKAIGEKGKIFISNRDKKKTHELSQKLSSTCHVGELSWPVSIEDTKDIDIIINCTSVGFENPIKDQNGFYSLKFYTPLGKIKNNIRLSQLENFNSKYAYEAAKDIAENFYETNRFLSQHKKILIFDIVYQPQITSLIFMSNLIGHKTLTGIGMNLEQAVIAFDITTSATGKRNLDQDEVRKFMIKAV